ncbi:hypothetical protein AB9Q04_01505 [Anaerococcus sp. ENR1011]|uniref:Restriction endonuclease type IV Mrr domain-containing protein n=1 Tax=Anaerococcus groningensis TaxID=3115616 RepID=A0ABW9MYT6_9FIRM
MQLTDKFTYDTCKNKTKYKIRHQNIPINLSKELREAIYYLLWYVPNIKSEQSEKNELLLNPQYDDFIFIEIMKAMGLKDEDVLFTETIDQEVIKPFLNEICTHCPKIIMTLATEETKTMALLRHIRNAIAHGNFNVIDDVVVGFDIQRYDNEIEYRGFFKLNPNKLLDALRKIQFDYNSQQLITQAFKNTGYFIEPYQEKYQRSHDFELFAKKSNKKYAIDIKNYEYEKTVDKHFIGKLINQYENLLEGIVPILIINTAFLDEFSKKELLNHDVIILDVKNIQKMVAGRDMVAEIERAHMYKTEKL